MRKLWILKLVICFLFIKFTPIVFAHDPAETDLESNIFSNMIEEKQLTPGIVFIGLLIAAVLGALHGLSPGHGKSIVAAYLVGTRGTLKHALFLGFTVTFTHTFGVFALGLIALFAPGYILPEQLYPYLSILSGAIVSIIGSVLFIKRIIPFFQNINHNRKYHTGVALLRRPLLTVSGSLYCFILANVPYLITFR